ncbi:MAG: glycosyl hydrolase 53 family protein [Prevotellaceae bacterium]|nr:glycosyl hydrolase 53 family protein [Candidatus Colivivens equi]
MKHLFILLSVVLSCFSMIAQTNNNHFVGMDLSMLTKYEEHNKPYLDKDGAEIKDLLEWIPSIGVNTVRVRLFVNPTEPNAKAPEGVCQDLDYVTRLGARIKAAGLNFMLDLHYSDSWADPTNQKLPASWNDCVTVDQKAEKVYNYTSEVLNTLATASATPDLVQVGNEISYGIIGINVHPYDNATDNWDGFVKVLENGCKAVRENCPNAKIIIHTERSGNAEQTLYFYNKLSNLDYDIIGLSYYPFWHGYMDKLEETLTTLGNSFPNKEVQIVETAYYNSWFPSSGTTYNTSTTWEASDAGQKAFIDQLVETLAKYPKVNGLCYWFPEEAGCGDDTDWNTTNTATVIQTWINRGLWWPEPDAKGHWPTSALYSLGKYSTSALDNINVDLSNNRQKYNLSGQRISNPNRREVYIQNGIKKIGL